MTEDTQAPLPTPAELGKATLVATTVAAVLLLSVVLPAEYGVDPTGIGSRLGLTQMKAHAARTPEPAAGVVRREAPFRNDEMSLTLFPGRGAEIKASMQKDDQFVFSWTATGPVNFDMHGDETNAPKDVFTSYWKEEQKDSGHGSFVAPFEGVNGWYWVNKGTRPVTVTVKTSGFYAKLARI